MRYKVIKEFGVAKKDDVFILDDCGFASLNVTETNNGSEYTRAMSMDECTADRLVDKGYLKELNDECQCCCQECACERIEDTVELIDELLDKYDKDNTEVQEKAKKGEIQPCVKVESETVYYNLTKVLNRIRKELVKEDE